MKLADDVAKRSRPPAPKQQLPDFLQTLVYQARRCAGQRRFNQPLFCLHYVAQQQLPDILQTLVYQARRGAGQLRLVYFSVVFVSGYRKNRLGIPMRLPTSRAVGLR